MRLRPLALATLASLGLAASGCAGRPGVAPSPAAEPLARLEQAVRLAPQSAAALRALGIAYHERGRDAEAREVLAEAQRLAPDDGTVALFLGLSAERQEDYAAARAAYTTYVKVGRTKKVRQQLEQRLHALARLEMAAEARAAVAREAQLGATAGPATTVAILPFAFHGTDSTLRPLARGLSELLAVDLGAVEALTVVERLQMQALLDELGLQRSGAVDTATAVRTGRLARAGSLVQGAVTQLDGDQVRADAAVVNVSTAAEMGSARESDKLDAVFAMEKRLARSVIAALGVRLTSAEQERLDERPTRNLAAFLAYGSGLLAEDEGDLDAAERHYRDAVRLDPGFGMARQRGMGAASARQGASVSSAEVRASLQGSAEGQVVTAAVNGESATPSGVGAALSQAVNGVNPSGAAAAAADGPGAGPAGRDAASSTAGTDGVRGGTGRIRIIVRPPQS
jgi:TolB-like protein